MWTDGKTNLGLALGLLGILGTGALGVWPAEIWIGLTMIAFAVIGLALLALHLFGLIPWEGRPNGKLSMTPADFSYNGALVAAFAAIIGVWRRAPRVAIIACALAWAGIGIDYWQMPRGFVFNSRPATLQEALLVGMSGSPIAWAAPSPEAPIPAAPSRELYVGSIMVSGGNVGTREIPLEDVYLISGITGERMNVHAFLYPKNYAPKELNPIPPKAFFAFFSDIFKTPLSPEQFLDDWRIITVIAEYEGQEHRVTFGDDKIAAQMPRRLSLGPHITPRTP